MKPVETTSMKLKVPLIPKGLTKETMKVEPDVESVVEGLVGAK